MTKIDNILARNKYSVSKTPSVVMAEMVLKIKALRKQKSYSQAELAERSGVSLGSIKRFERTGKVSLESILRIAHVLGRLQDFDTVFHYDNLMERVRKKFDKD
ncbi:MAG: transcriptional regulator with XRE-family HTH domain [Saprospiraceae bacterium]|jgi:transcriptional regulator with XRE-family HTH domain